MKLLSKDSVAQRIENDARRWRRRQRQFAKRRVLQGEKEGASHFLKSARNIKR